MKKASKSMSQTYYATKKLVIVGRVIQQWDKIPEGVPFGRVEAGLKSGSIVTKLPHGMQAPAAAASTPGAVPQAKPTAETAAPARKSQRPASPTQGSGTQAS